MAKNIGTQIIEKLDNIESKLNTIESNQKASKRSPAFDLGFAVIIVGLALYVATGEVMFFALVGLGAVMIYGERFISFYQWSKYGIKRAPKTELDGRREEKVERIPMERKEEKVKRTPIKKRNKLLLLMIIIVCLIVGGSIAIYSIFQMTNVTELQDDELLAQYFEEFKPEATRILDIWINETEPYNYSLINKLGMDIYELSNEYQVKVNVLETTDSHKKFRDYFLLSLDKCELTGSFLVVYDFENGNDAMNEAKEYQENAWEEYLDLGYTS